MLQCGGLRSIATNLIGTAVFCVFIDDNYLIILT